MSNYTSTHVFDDGNTVTVEKLSSEVGIRIQGDDEVMLCDIVMPSFSALCIAQSILSVLTKGEEDEHDDVRSI